ncbi:hypothetical protein H8356DRAFT_1624360 [Neocallimastix lanati (nom. inval.)]|nr:hypothetical protein H8356DRAFT_1624360 [Neocallimastix sp. JGI-2020a]
MVKCLVEHGADIYKENQEGETPLSLAYENGDDELIKYLIDHVTKENNKKRKK